MDRKGIKIWDQGRVFLIEGYSNLLKKNGLTTFHDFFSHPGHEDAKCVLSTRNTVRIDLVDGKDKRPFFLKRYRPKREKGLFGITLPFLKNRTDAKNEWEAMFCFMNAGLPGPRPVAYGEDGPFSFVMSEGVPHSMKLSQWAERYLEKDKKMTADLVRKKRMIIETVAKIVGKMHASGMNHQDLYLCHFLCGDEESGLPLTLIDLQRVVMRKRLAKRWQVKDLAQLYFSSAPYVTRSDIWRFWKKYSKIYDSRRDRRRLWMAIYRKSERIRRHTKKHNL